MKTITIELQDRYYQFYELLSQSTTITIEGLIELAATHHAITLAGILQPTDDGKGLS